MISSDISAISHYSSLILELNLSNLDVSDFAIIVELTRESGIPLSDLSCPFGVYLLLLYAFSAERPRHFLNLCIAQVTAFLLLSLLDSLLLQLGCRLDLLPLDMLLPLVVVLLHLEGMVQVSRIDVRFEPIV